MPVVDTVTVLEGSKIVNPTIDSGITFPGSPTTGELFFDTVSSALFVYDGVVWNKLGIGVGAAFPGSPTTGNLFYNTTLNDLYAFDGSNWHIVGITDTGLRSSAEKIFAFRNLG